MHISSCFEISGLTLGDVSDSVHMSSACMNDTINNYYHGCILKFNNIIDLELLHIGCWARLFVDLMVQLNTIIILFEHMQVVFIINDVYTHSQESPQEMTLCCFSLKGHNSKFLSLYIA